LRQERREQNQRLFQEANRRLHDLVECRLPNLTSVSFLCECADEECIGRGEITLPLWEDVSQRPNHFLIIAGHPGIEVFGTPGRDGQPSATLAVSLSSLRITGVPL
jgi:hypothetical protein